MDDKGEGSSSGTAGARPRFHYRRGSESERSDVSFSTDDEDLYIPNDSDEEYSDLSDDLDFMLCKEELKDSESFFKDVISREYKSYRTSNADIAADLQSALEKNEILIKMTADLKEKLLLVRDELRGTLAGKVPLDEPSDIFESSGEDIESLLNMTFNPVNDDLLYGNSESKTNEERAIHQLGRFYSQFGGTYFKDSAGFFCPPNEHTRQIRREEKVSPSELVKNCKDWSEKQLKLVEDIMKKCLLDDYSEKEGPESVKFKQYSVIVNKFPLDELLKDKEYKFDWMKVSALLNSVHKVQRSPVDLERLWINCLHPKYNKSDWSDEEEKKILELVELHGCHSWDLIEKELGTNRGMFNVYSYYTKELQYKQSIGTKWTEEEDEQLKNLVERFTFSGRIPWMKVMYYFERRSYDQVYNRWHNTLLASKLGKFSPTEDKALVSAFFQHNLGSNVLKKVLNKRTYKQIRGRLESLKSIKQGKVFGEFTLEEDQKLVDLVKRVGPKWSDIAKEFVSRDRTQLRHRYNKLKRKLEDPQFRLEDIDRSKSDLRDHLQSRNDKLLKLMDKKNRVTSRDAQKKFLKFQQNLTDDFDGVVNEYDNSEQRGGLPKSDAVVNYLFEVGSSRWKEEISSKVMSLQTANLTNTVCCILEAKLDEDLVDESDEHLSPIIDLINPPNKELLAIKKTIFNNSGSSLCQSQTSSISRSVAVFDQPSTSGMSNFSSKTPPDFNVTINEAIIDSSRSPESLVSVDQPSTSGMSTISLTDNPHDPDASSDPRGIDLPPLEKTEVTLQPGDLDEIWSSLPTSFFNLGISNPANLVIPKNVDLSETDLEDSVLYDLNASGQTCDSPDISEEPSSEDQSTTKRMCNINVLPPSFPNTNAFVNLLFHLSRIQHIKRFAPQPSQESPEVTQAKRLWMKRLYKLFLLPAVHTSGRKKKATIAYERTYMG